MSLPVVGAVGSRCAVRNRRRTRRRPPKKFPNPATGRDFRDGGDGAASRGGGCVIAVVFSIVALALAGGSVQRNGTTATSWQSCEVVATSKSEGTNAKTSHRAVRFDPAPSTNLCRLHRGNSVRLPSGNFTAGNITPRRPPRAASVANCGSQANCSSHRQSHRCRQDRPAPGLC